MAANTTPTPPTTMAEAEAAEQQVAAFYLTRVEAARQVLTGPEAQAFEAKIAELIADGLPVGTSVAANLPQLSKWFIDVRIGADADFEKLDVMANPSAPATEPEVPAQTEA